MGDRERMGSLRIKGRLEPLHRSLDQHHIKTAGRRRWQAQQVVPGRKNDALLLGDADAGPGAAKRTARPAAHFDKHQRAVALAHDQINLATAASGRPIIAHHQLQASRLQMGQGLVLRHIAAFARGGGGGSRARAPRRFSLSKEFH